MAEIALGGIEIAIRSTRGEAQTCAHVSTLSTISSGIERAVCEECGHLSIRFHRAVSGPIDRERFARPADEARESAEEVTRAPTARYRFDPGRSDGSKAFAHRPHLRVQPRPDRDKQVLSLRG